MIVVCKKRPKMDDFFLRLWDRKFKNGQNLHPVRLKNALFIRRKEALSLIEKGILKRNNFIFARIYYSLSYFFKLFYSSL